MTDILKSYLEARTQLQQEQTTLKSRLQELNRVLGQAAVVSAGAASQPTAQSPKKRKMSRAARARISAAATARWAKRKAAGKNRL